MRQLDWQALNESERSQVLQRPRVPNKLRENVADIVSAVKSEGDRAIQGYTKTFDKCLLVDSMVASQDLAAAAQQVDPKIKEALTLATRNIETFHKSQLRASYAVKVAEGIELAREIRPIQKIGLYIPGGSAPLLSTLLMLAIPARLAACSDIILCTPADADGRVDSSLMGTAFDLGITRVYRIGGAQAIAAMAYGTDRVPKVDKIFGPGNAWVTEAKLIVSQDPEGAAIDLPAGPSELMVIGDSKSNPRFIASDLLSQAEHGRDSQVIFVSLDPGLIKKVQDEINQLLPKLTRFQTVIEALECAVFIDARDRDSALDIIERYAPEHLSLQLENPESMISRIHNAGSIFCGQWSPEAAGDYATGTNHVLPTGGWARSLSGLTVEAFQRTMSVQTLSARGLSALSAAIQTLAAVEKLDAHALAVQVRMDALLQKGGSNAY